MEQIYLIEIFVDKVTVFVGEDDNVGADKKLIIKIKFGPKAQFIIKEGQLAVNTDNKDEIVECDENGRKKWSRTIRVGKSYLFPSYPDTILMILSKFPLEIEVWTDDENEIEEFIGIGTMVWDTQFFFMLKESSEACKIHEPLSIKQTPPLFAECCCRQVGDISFILRLSALGESIITEFQQLLKEPDSFVFRTNKAPSMFQCKRIEGDDPNFCMAGSLYETTTLEDPTIIQKVDDTIEVCTELKSCGIIQEGVDYTCMNENEEKPEVKEKKEYTIDKIRMGDITGPCGNTNCPLAHKIKMYIRNLDSYKSEATGRVIEPKTDKERKVCGECVCKNERWHREDCKEREAEPKKEKPEKVVCSGCMGKADPGKTCEDEKNKKFGTGATPKGSHTQVNYVFNITKPQNIKYSTYGKQYVLENCIHLTDTEFDNYNTYDSRPTCKTLQENSYDQSSENNVVTNVLFDECHIDPNIYNFKVSQSKRNLPVFICTDLPPDKECRCSPYKPPPPCKTFDCNCIPESLNIASRKAHKPYCPLYKHKDNCPVTLMNEEEETVKAEDEEKEVEPLPYGLPPIKLGPCPVLGKPCTYPDGFARMYKTGALAAQPPSYSDAGKVCCSKEYERIQKALKDYMKYEKESDFRCLNKFNVDTEKRCCDKEQTLLALMGKQCCGSHKLAIQEKFKEDKK